MVLTQLGRRAFRFDITCLLFLSKLVKRGLERVLEKRRGRDESRHRVCVLTPNCATYASALLGIWSCELPITAVPLCKAHPEKPLGSIQI